VARSTIKERPLNTDQAFFEHMQDMREGIGTAVDQIMTAGPDHLILGIALETMSYCGANISKDRCPLWVKSGHRAVSGQCPLYPQKRT
jgi:hypothetical protein